MPKKLSKKVMQKQQDENERLHQEMMDRCLPIAQEVIRIASEHGIKVVDGDPNLQKEHRPEYREASLKVIEMMTKNNVHWIEREFIFMLASQPVQQIKQIVMQDLQRTFEHQICRLFGVSTFDELTMQQIEEGLVRFAKDAQPTYEKK